MTETQRPLPHATAWSAPYWDAARDKRFVIQHCTDCDRPIMYPRRFCPHCLNDTLEFRPSEGRGEIYTMTVQVAGPPSGFGDRLPYVVAVIRLDEGVQLMSNIVGDDRESARIGDRVRVDFETVEDGQTVLPVFRLERG
ncbi:OB-fold domain-containing protein [Roseovarius sp.]|uniref:Zn-ribbon domain-containing OB-fold protein n=1 Tax=Roseovarius sp. TaxID=1486281 RepID=UPI002602EA75|nr:OB-fold domain-containing protein [Roseovarius sp.]MDM8166684.1 OB-fold domain-containing protein [Roseovarius sp.]